jgi:site-specific recombinase XerD
MQNKIALETLYEIQDAYAPATMRAYRADLFEFESYCAKCNYSALPATTFTIASFIDYVATQEIASATIRRKLAAIAAIHRWAGYADPTKEPAAKLAVRKMHRKLGRYLKQAHGLTHVDVQKMIAATDDSLRGARDRLLLNLAYDTMRRRSELTWLRI